MEMEKQDAAVVHCNYYVQIDDALMRGWMCLVYVATGDIMHISHESFFV